MNKSAARGSKAIWLLVLLAVLTGALAVAFGGRVWLLISTRKISLVEAYPGMRSEQDGEPVRGWYRVKRWDQFVEPGDKRHGRAIWFYERNGVLAGESFWEHGRYLQRTMWNLDGTVKEQFRLYDKHRKRFLPVADRTRTEPPWWGDVSDQ